MDGGSSPVDRCHGVGRAGGQLVRGEVCEQGVHPVQGARYEPADEQVRTFELGDPGGRVGAAQDLVAQLGVELAEHGGREHERARLLVECRDHLLGEVVGHEPLLAAERVHGNGAVAIGNTSEPEGREHQRCGPALRSLVEQADLVGAQVEAVPLHEELLRLGLGEGEIRGADLGEHPRCAVPGQAERGIRPRQQDQPDVRRERLDRPVEGREALRIGHGVQVVEHHDEVLAEAAQRVQERVEAAIGEPAGHAQPMPRTPAESLADAIRARGHVAPEARRVVVDGVQRHPDHRRLAGGAPGERGGRLSVPDRRADDRQCRPGRIEQPQEPRPLDQPFPEAGDRELGGGDRHGQAGGGGWGSPPATCTRTGGVAHSAIVTLGTVGARSQGRDGGASPPTGEAGATRRVGLPGAAARSRASPRARGDPRRRARPPARLAAARTAVRLQRRRGAALRLEGGAVLQRRRPRPRLLREPARPDLPALGRVRRPLRRRGRALAVPQRPRRRVPDRAGWWWR